MRAEPGRRRAPKAVGGAFLCLAAMGVSLRAGSAGAQTDYYNTDEGRPVRVEDASAVERYAFELQLASLRLARVAGGGYEWEAEPGVAYGILPRTHLEIAVPLRYLDAPAGETLGAAGVEVGVLHNLNTETRLPALAVAAELSLPVGGLAADDTYLSLTGILTRTLGFGRVHLNAGGTLGPDVESADAAGERSRWMAGLAVDHAVPLRSFLVTGAILAEQPLDGSEVAWTAEAGFRVQTSPQFNMDLGAGRSFTGDDREWYLTVGFAHAFSIGSLMPGRTP